MASDVTAKGISLGDIISTVANCFHFSYFVLSS